MFKTKGRVTLKIVWIFIFKYLVILGVLDLKLNYLWKSNLMASWDFKRFKIAKLNSV
jgi:hypothetical protein